MTAGTKAAALGFVVSTVVGVPLARAQLQPPPFDAPPAQAVPAPPPAPAPPPPAPPPRTAPAQPPRTAQPAPAPAPSQRPQAPPALRADEEAIDDPKVSRRLGARITIPPPAPPRAAPPPPRTAQPPASAPPPRTAQAPAPSQRPQAPPAPRADEEAIDDPKVSRRPVPPPAPVPVRAPTPTPAPAPAPIEAADIPAVERPYTPPEEARFEPTLPRLKLGLRRFQFVQIGASNSPSGVAAPESFNNFSVDVYPVSRLVRIGLTSAFGWQSGTWLSDGDYFATQTVSLGLQYKDLGRVVPFIEGFGGVGYMRRVQFDRTIPTAFWQFGVDAGMEIYVARVGYLSLALGYLRPINGFAKRQQFTSVYVDTWSFKLGIGI